MMEGQRGLATGGARQSLLLIGALFNVVTLWVIQFNADVAGRDLLVGPVLNASMVLLTLRYRRFVWSLIALALLHLPGRGPEWQERLIVGVLTTASVSALLLWGRARRGGEVTRVDVGRGAWSRCTGFPFDRPLHRDITLFWPSFMWLSFNVGYYVWLYQDLIRDGQHASIYGAGVGFFLATLLPIYGVASLRRALRSRRSR